MYYKRVLRERQRGRRKPKRQPELQGTNLESRISKLPEENADKARGDFGYALLITVKSTRENAAACSGVLMSTHALRIAVIRYPPVRRYMRGV